MDKKRKNHIGLWRKGVSLLCITALAAFPLSGCTLKNTYQKEEEASQGELDIKIELTENEMEQAHLTTDFMDKVKIDAKITPYHLYKDGVGTYYNLNGQMWTPDNNTIKLDKKAKDSTIEDLTYFGKSIGEIAKLLETAGGRKAQMEKMDWKFHKKYGNHQISVPFTSEGNEDDAILEMHWECPTDEDDNPMLNSKKLYSYNFNITSGAGAQAQSLVEGIKFEHAPYDTEESLSFADSGETAGMLREMLTELTGYEYSEDYDVIPMDSAVIEEASKNVGQTRQEMEEGNASGLTSLIKPCYYYCFYQELDGLPLRGSSQSILADKDTNLSKELRKEIKDKDTTYTKTQIDHYCLSYVEIIYDETGIIFLQLGNDFVSDTEPGEEKKPVINLSDLLEPLYEHFGSVVSIDTTVYEIRLGYRASFTEVEGEPIRRILTPVWIVKYDTLINGKRSETVCFDGYTGVQLEFANVF